MELSIISSTFPNTLTKAFSIVEGELNKKTSASLVSGVAERVQFSSITEFSDILKSLKTHQACCYGLARMQKVRVLAKTEYKKQKNPNDAITRTESNFSWSNSFGVMMLDYDPVDGVSALNMDKLREVIFEAVPELKHSDHCTMHSSGALIYSTITGEILVGEKGKRIYILVKDASDIPRAGKALVQRLWLKGYGFIFLGKAGQFLERCPVDSSVWQASRLDFAAGAKCESGLEQRRGEPTVYEYGVSLDTKVSIPSLTSSEEKAYRSLVEIEKEKVKPQSEKRKEIYSTALALKMIEASNNRISYEVAQASIKNMLESTVLSGEINIHLDDGRLIKVQDIIDNPDSFEGALTKDPIEPEYDNNRTVGKIYTRGKLGIFSQAHGGCFYRIVKNPIEIFIDGGELSFAVDKTLEHLRKLPDICNMAGSLVRVFGGKIIPFNSYSLMHFLGGEIQYSVEGKNLKPKDVNPPSDLINQILSVSDDIKGVKILESVINSPTVRLDGSLITQQGYDQKTGLYLDLDFEFQGINNSPTRENVKDAINELMKPFNSFPFKENIDKSVLLAGLLSAIVRPILPTCPALAFDAPVQGSGKTLLASCVAALSTGDKPSIHPHTSLNSKSADEEIKKMLLSDLMSGSRALIWDNVLGVFSSAVIASMLTSTSMHGRVLGASKIVHVPNKMFFILTGNNLCFAGDMPRRVLTCGIDPKMANPFARSFEVEPLEYVLRNREKLVVAALTIIRGWFNSSEFRLNKVASGRMASFENWDDLVRQPVAWIAKYVMPKEYVDVMDAVKEAQNNDPEQELLHDLMLALKGAFANRNFLAKEVVGKLFHNSPLSDAVEGFIHSSRPNSRNIGKVLNYHKNKIIEGLSIACFKNRREGNRYRIVDEKDNRNEDNIVRKVYGFPPVPPAVPSKRPPTPQGGPNRTPEPPLSG